MTLICHQALTDTLSILFFQLAHPALISERLDLYTYVMNGLFHIAKTWLRCKSMFLYSIWYLLKWHEANSSCLRCSNQHFQLTLCPISSTLVNKGLMHKNYPYIDIAPENASRLIYGMKRVVILWAQKWKRLLSLQREYCKITYTLVRRKEKL